MIFFLVWNIMFTGYYKVFVLKFSEMEKIKSWWKYDIYWLLKSSCFQLFGDGKYDLFFSQRVNEKMIFTWSLWVFYDIPGRGKYGFSCSVSKHNKGIRFLLCFLDICSKFAWVIPLKNKRVIIITATIINTF